MAEPIEISHDFLINHTHKAGEGGKISYGDLDGCPADMGQGPKGDKGDRGDIGPQGPQGPSGSAGAAGPKGDAGAQGPPGQAGSPGIQGPKGDTGSQGPQGIQGVKGDTGSQGIQGPQGNVGPPGTTDYNALLNKPTIPAGPSVAATPTTTGAMTVTMTDTVKTITPTGACTFNASGGTAGRECTFIITTSGTTAFTLTFGTNFKAAGTLSTGTVSGKVFSVHFACKDGTLWVEAGRTAAM